jgi:myo-inositol 2-dehydrogenase / D-chiro-inositol 1-dehydrogenase
MENNQPKRPNRREFIKSTSKALAGTTAAFYIGLPKSFAFTSDTLKVGLIGCGGRGTGAASQALSADPNVILTAMGDVFRDRLDTSYGELEKSNPDKLKVAEDHKFIGFDAYEKVLASDVDVVILTTPPAFRPGHLEAAVAAGKHIFCEKPVAVDAPGIRRVIEVAKKAKEKNLALMSGFCWRYDFPKRETFQRVLDGQIGDVMTLYNTYNTGELWYRDPAPDWTSMHNKLRNWIYHNWLSGDHIAEQAVHSLDMMSWAMGDQLPVSATGTGGRQSRTEEKYGNIYDHFAIAYDYENGARGFHFSRQQKGTSRAYGIDIQGTKGRCEIDVWKKHQISGETNWRYKGDTNNMYQTEHDELFASIRAGNPINDGIRMANSTMHAILGRMVAYTGQTLTWEEAINSNEVLGPKLDEYNWNLEWPDAPIAKPGQTEFQ